MSAAQEPEQPTGETCVICCEAIVYYGVNFPCKHSTCWNCALKSKLKLGADNCAYCKEPVEQILVARDPSAELDANTVTDPDLGIHYANQ